MKSGTSASSHENLFATALEACIHTAS